MGPNAIGTAERRAPVTSKAQITKIASKDGVDARVVERDYVLAHIVAKRKRFEFFTRIALAGSKELRSHLALDETHYLKLTLEEQSDARAYFMYSVLDTVYEAGVAMMRWEDLLVGDEDEQAADGSIEDRLTNESLGAEGAMWTRRLIEALTTLICFSSTNEELYYRHWLLVDQLVAFSYTHKDERDYYACQSKGLLRWIDKSIANIRAMEGSIDFARCWYLRDKRPLPASPGSRLLTDFASNLRTAIRHASPKEKTALGLSYKHFSRVSGTIHFSPGDKWYERSGSRSESPLPDRCDPGFASFRDLTLLPERQATLKISVTGGAPAQWRPAITS